MKLWRGIVRIIGALVILALVLCIPATWLVMQIVTPMGPGPAQRVTVARGASPAAIGEDLARRHLIHSELSFRVLVWYTRSGDRIQAGTYELSPAMSAVTILKTMIEGKVVPPETHWVTIPEGFTMEQIAARLAANAPWKATGAQPAKEEFLALARSGAFPVHLGPGAPILHPPALEGYLFPATYDIPPDSTPRQVLEKMVGAFEARVVPEYLKAGRRAPLNLPGILVMASLVEREAQVASERPVIAGVYYNRLKLGMPLQCDATIQYALGEQKPVLTYADLKIDSPYNTYRYPGLPPGPIANPGLASILAALAPAKTPYLFYVRNDVADDGSHVFATTLAGHQANIARYQRHR